MEIIPHFDYGGSGLPLHFLHANGYPPECYQPLLELFKTKYRVFGMKLRPLWGEAHMNDIKDWQPFTEDLLRFLSNCKTSRVIGVGHSIGGTVTLRAALRQPDQFRAIILFDPVLFVPFFSLLWNIIRAIGLGDQFHPMIAGALKRRRVFDDLDTVFRGYRSRSIFKYMSDEDLRAYIHGIARPGKNGGYELVFSPEWEAHIYRTGIHDFDLWRDLPKLITPCLIIRGAETNTFTERAARLVKQKQPRVKIETLEKSTHILPLERPQEVFDITEKFLKNL